jgi:hypothetical protein
LLVTGKKEKKRKRKKRWNVSKSEKSASAFRHVLRKIFTYLPYFILN